MLDKEQSEYLIRQLSGSFCWFMLSIWTILPHTVELTNRIRDLNEMALKTMIRILILVFVESWSVTRWYAHH